MRPRNRLVLSAVDVLLGLLACGGAVISSHHAHTGGYLLVVIASVLAIAATLMGYAESSAKWAWVHGPLMMTVEILGLPLAALTCRSFECAGVIAFLIVANIFALVLIFLSYAGFFLRRRLGVIPARETN
jgi:hypothetical protein